MKTYHIHINGIVQGVGFRPAVYALAKQMQLNGYVKNGNDGLHVVFNASEQAAGLFFKKIEQNAPAHAKIISADLDEIANTSFDDFLIVVENDDNKKDVLISPDKSICDECRRELYDKNNLRYRYPFITCTHCGPRYSIIHELPYERESTSMQDFYMCENCFAEYEKVSDRRFFSQTNSCEDCGVELCIKDNSSFNLFNDSERVLSYIRQFLINGKIVAVKGIGGYLLLCDAANSGVVTLLRARKHRSSKPFAVLYQDIKTIRQEFELTETERVLLESAEAPIVLLFPKNNAHQNVSKNNIAPRLSRIGVMLPNNALLHLIATDYGKPLIATSANISGSPIIYTENDDYLFEVADYIVTHTRDIVIPQDDSVIQVSRYSNKQIFLRRSRGYAPSFLQYKPRTKVCVLSTGAFLKSSFTLAVHGNLFVSQFLGSGESYESQQMYKDTLQHWLRLYKIKPDIILADMHPGYFSHQYAIELAKEYGIDVKFIQHHEAHFAAVLAENNLLHSAEPVLGIIWDGAGLGRDGNLWGGEFFKYENNEMVRVNHFDYFPVITGDKMAMEPRISALCTASDTQPLPKKLKEKFTEAELNNYQALLKTTHLFSSSAGRIFDAVASLLNVCQKQTYEGEAAMYLQVLAEDYANENGFVIDDSYFKETSYCDRISTAFLIQGIILDLKRGRSKNYIAAKFYYSLVCIIGIVAANIHVEKICCSGGVFQNDLLTDWIQKIHGDKYKCYFHKNLSPNDENISFGQLVYYENKIKGRNKANFSTITIQSSAFTNYDSQLTTDNS